MADIDVVKKRSYAWVWIVVLVALALILWFMRAGNNSPQTTGQFLHDDGGQPHRAAVLVAA